MLSNNSVLNVWAVTEEKLNLRNYVWTEPNRTKQNTNILRLQRINPKWIISCSKTISSLLLEVALRRTPWKLNPQPFVQGDSDDSCVDGEGCEWATGSSQTSLQSTRRMSFRKRQGEGKTARVVRKAHDADCICAAVDDCYCGSEHSFSSRRAPMCEMH